MRMSPPVMSLTFLAKSSAYSWKMSLVGQVLCQRMLIGPCALTTLGAATAAAPATAAPLRNLRREVLASPAVLDFVIVSSQSIARTRSPAFKRTLRNDVCGPKFKRDKRTFLFLFRL